MARRQALAVVFALVGVLGAATLAVCQGRAWWRALDRPDSPLCGFAASAEPRSPRLARRVVLVILDGLRVDQAREMATLNALRARGAERVLATRFPSTSIPQYYAALSGIDPDVSGARTNRYRKYTWPLDSVLRRAREAGLRVATVGPHRPWFTPVFGRLFGFAGFGNEHYDENLSAALASGADLTVIVEDHIDRAGHRYGGNSAEYAAAAAGVDQKLAQMVAPLDLARDAVVVTADHGHLDAGGHGGAEPEVVHVPLVAAGAGIRPGRYDAAELIDVGPTLAALLGVSPPAGARGRPLTDLLDLPPATAAALDHAAAMRRAAVDRFLAARMSGDDRAAASRRRLRLGALAAVAIALLLALRRVRAGGRALLCGLAYLGAFVIAAGLAGGRLSLSWASSERAVVTTLVIATIIAGAVYLWMASRSRRARDSSTPLPELLGAAACAAVPWLVAWAVQGTQPGVFLPSPWWTAMGIWAGLPLICFAPWAVVDLVRFTRPIRPAWISSWRAAPEIRREQ